MSRQFLTDGLNMYLYGFIGFLSKIWKSYFVSHEPNRWSFYAVYAKHRNSVLQFCLANQLISYIWGNIILHSVMWSKSVKVIKRVSGDSYNTFETSFIKICISCNRYKILFIRWPFCTEKSIFRHISNGCRNKVYMLHISVTKKYRVLLSWKRCQLCDKAFTTYLYYDDHIQTI